MRVALVNLTTTTKIGGVETFVRQLARFLAASAIDVSIFGGASPHNDEFAAPPDVRVHTTPYIDRGQFRRLPVFSRQYGAAKLLERTSFAFGARAILESGDFDIIHIHKPFDFPLAAWLRARTRARVVYSSHGRDFFPGDRQFVRSLDVLTACSHYNAADVLARYHRTARVIYNGVDIDQFRPLTPTARWQAVAPPGVPVALWAGRLVRWKGTIDAVRAVALARTPVHLSIAGTGPEMPRLMEAARALGIQQRVHFLGVVPHEELPGLLATTQVVLGTSFANETFGMTLAEASACGRPVIATDFGGFPEVVHHNETGLLVPPRDPAQLAAAIDAIVGNPTEAARMGAAGRAFVIGAFAWPKVTERVVAAYEEALDAH